MKTSRLLLAALLSACSQAAPGETLDLHVPSPDWRDQIIYFVMIDRFDDADPANNDQGAGEYDPTDHRKYSGGDLAGIARRVDYIRGLGATALWITPPVANQWWDGQLGYGGYHGYWAEHFMKVDAHYGTLDDYRALSHALHSAGMYLIQDVVVNHTGNFFGYRGGWERAERSRHFQPNPDSRPVSAPRQWPFSQNDVRNSEHRQADIYHWTPTITDFRDREQELDFQLADLDDLNTENPIVRTALRQSYAHWIREVGVDAFRIDTAYHVPPDYFRDFLYGEDPEHPGMLAAARATGRDGFLAFGEGFGVDRAHDDHHARKLETYVRDESGQPLLSSMINFPLYGSALDVFARGRPTAELGHRIGSMMTVHANPQLMPTFIDNHDVDRFLSGASEAALKQGLLMLMTLPGIPTLYYGTEQGFRERRRAMFAGGFASGGRDHFDREAPLYRYIAEIAALRREHRLFSRGTPTVLAANPAAAGALAWRMDYGETAALVVFNTAGRDALLDIADSGWPSGTRLEPAFAIDSDARPLTARAGAGGRVTVRLPPRVGWVFLADSSDSLTTQGRTRHPLSILGLEPVVPPTPETSGSAFTDAIDAHGVARRMDSFLLVIDDDLARARAIRPDAKGRWRARIDTSSMIDPALEHSVVAWSETTGAISERRRFRVERRWTLLAAIEDPAGDDHGPHGRYQYPTDAGWGAHRQLDIRAARAFGSSGSLRIELDMHSVTHGWNPANGFDRVAFTIYVELPERDGGARVMPLQNAELPGDMRWHYRLRIGGWSNVLHASPGASATSEGTPVAAAARIEVDTAARRIRFTLPASSIGDPETLLGARIHVTTWDQDGHYRELAPQPGSHSFGGGDDRHDPLVMDDVRLHLDDRTTGGESSRRGSGE